MRISDWSSDVCSSDLNHAEGVNSSPGAYYTDGKTPTGSQRWKCRSCGSRFSAKGPTVGQKKPHENELVFKLLVNKNSIRSIARVADLSPKAVYGKIDFIHRQCLAFAADRERALQNLPQIGSEAGGERGCQSV